MIIVLSDYWNPAIHTEKYEEFSTLAFIASLFSVVLFTYLQRTLAIHFQKIAMWHEESNDSEDFSDGNCEIKEGRNGVGQKLSYFDIAMASTLNPKTVHPIKFNLSI